MTFCFGVWLKDMAFGLFWRGVFVLGNVRTESDEFGIPYFDGLELGIDVALSWSWASRDGLIEFWDR